jgi:small-conductance mechanosensitive channel
MSFNVGTLWAIYIIVVIISFIIFWLFLKSAQYYYPSINYGSVFFLASLLGAIAVFIGAAWLDPNQLNSTEKTWLTILFLIAFLFPIFIILYILWTGEYSSFTGNENYLSSCSQDSCKCQKNPCECKRIDPCECQKKSL